MAKFKTSISPPVTLPYASWELHLLRLPRLPSVLNAIWQGFVPSQPKGYASIPRMQPRTTRPCSAPAYHRPRARRPSPKKPTMCSVTLTYTTQLQVTAVVITYPAAACHSGKHIITTITATIWESYTAVEQFICGLAHCTQCQFHRTNKAVGRHRSPLVHRGLSIALDIPESPSKHGVYPNSRKPRNR